MRGLLLATLFVLAFASTSGCSPSGAEPSPGLPQGVGTHRLLVQPDDAQKTNREIIKSLIASAKQSIYLTIYELSDQDIIDFMVAAKTANQALDIRVIFNCAAFKVCNQPGQGDAKDPNAVAKKAFSNAGIPWKNADPKFAVTHQKTFTFDEAMSIIMTFNLSLNYFVSTRDFGVITRTPDEVKEIVMVFRNDWATPIVPSSPSLLVWSPTNSRERTKSVIASASQSLDVYMEEFNDGDIADVLIAVAKRIKPSGGVVRFITAVLPVPGNPSADGNLAMRYLNRNGVLVRYGDWPISPDNQDGPKMYIHAKMVLADYRTPEAKAFVGSENFSPASLDKNRELGIILRMVPDAGLLDTLNRTFSVDWPKCRTDS